MEKYFSDMELMQRKNLPKAQILSLYVWFYKLNLSLLALFQIIKTEEMSDNILDHIRTIADRTE